MKDWIVVHEYADNSTAIIRKDSINYVGKDIGGVTLIRAFDHFWKINEKYEDIVRRLVE